MIRGLTVLLVLLAPGAAWACATCVSSAYGDRTFNWAFLGLILMPFVVTAGVAGGIGAWYYTATGVPPWRFRPPFWPFSSSGRALPGAAQPAPHEESSL